MATRHYKTLRGLLSQTTCHYLNYLDLKRGRFYHKNAGWVNFTLPSLEIEKAYTAMASVIYANGERNAYRLINYRGKHHGILERLMINKRGATYCSGQDYPSEIKEIQKIFRS